MLQTISIVISGKVQGVFFRQSAREMAVSIGITGTIKNLYDGSVEIVATGTKDQLNSFVEWCKKGPPNAIVAGVEVRDLSLQEFLHFTIIRF